MAGNKSQNGRRPNSSTPHPIVAAHTIDAARTDDHVFQALPPGTHHGFPPRRQPPQVSPQQMGHVSIEKISQEPEETGRTQRAETISDHVADSRAPRRGRTEEQRTDDGNDVRRPQFHKAGDDRNPHLERNQHGRINRRNLRGQNQQPGILPNVPQFPIPPPRVPA